MRRSPLRGSVPTSAEPRGHNYLGRNASPKRAAASLGYVMARVGWLALSCAKRPGTGCDLACACVARVRFCRGPSAPTERYRSVSWAELCRNAETSARCPVRFVVSRSRVQLLPPAPVVSATSVVGRSVSVVGCGRRIRLRSREPLSPSLTMPNRAVTLGP